MGREGKGAIAQAKTKRCVLLLALLSFSFCCVILDYLRLSLLVKHARILFKVEYLIVFGADWAKFPALALLIDVFGCWILSF